MTEKCLELKEIKKSFSKEETVLKEISLSIDKGEFITLLGSSGCGKTLRIIAGLETPDSGRVFLDGRDVTGLAPEARDVNTVFQNYALFPHMTVADNIGYGATTVHRALNISIKFEDYKKKVKSRAELLKEADVLIIDEISMCRFDLFNMIAKTIITENEERVVDRLLSGEGKEDV